MTVFSKLFKDKSGNFAVLFALLITPLIIAAGGAIDLSSGYSISQRLKAAGDAAVLGAIAEQSEGVLDATSKNTNGRVPVSEEIARRLFKSNIQELAATMDVSVEPVVIRQGSKFTATLRYSTNLPTDFMRIIGVKTFPISGIAEAKFDTSTYQNLYLLLDNSPSMGLAATSAEMVKLRAATITKEDPSGCAFACHNTDSKGVPVARNYLDVARSLGINLRIDLVSQSVAALMDTAKASRRYPDQFGFALYTYGKDTRSLGLTELESITRDYDALKAAAPDIQLMQIKGYVNNYELTDTEAMMRGVVEKMPEQGTGRSPLDPENILFVVTDGVTDAYRTTCNVAFYTVSTGRCIQSVLKDVCQEIKNKNIRIAILYTTYFAPYGANSWGPVYPIRNKIAPDLESCASPGLYFEVDAGERMSQAMKTLFFRAIRAPVLTQ